MSYYLNIDHSVDELKRNCQEDISRVQSDIYDFEHKLAELEKFSGMSKLIHAGQIKKRREFLTKELEEAKKKLSEFNAEFAMYQRYGKDIPKDAPNYEVLAKMLEKRINKLEIILMVDLGMM